MRKFCHKWLAIALLLALPLQGLSAVLMPFHCLSDSQHEAATVGAHQHQTNLAHEHDRNSAATTQDDGGPSSNQAGHLCCNHVYTGVPSVAALTTPDTPFVAVDQNFIVPQPFVPEQLLRPPRT
jgi:hypothetical protein